MSTIHLIGGGKAGTSLYEHVVADCPGDKPRIATVLVDEGNGSEDVLRFVDVLTAAGSCEPVPVLVPRGSEFDPSVLDGMDAMFVCGGLTPAYAMAMAPAAAAIREWLAAADHVYAGFSAGAAIASERALVGGWLIDGIPVCHEDSAEDLDEVTVVHGLGLVPFAVDVHCAPWGTLSRLAAAVEVGAVRSGVGIDEDTMLTIRDRTVTVTGFGRAWQVAPDAGSLRIRPLHDGGRLEVADLSS